MDNNNITQLHNITPEEFGVGFVADSDENAFYSDFFSAAVIVFQACTGNAAFVAQDFIDRAVELEDDFTFFNALHQFVHHDFFGAEAVAAVNQGNGVGDIGKVEVASNLFVPQTMPPFVSA